MPRLSDLTDYSYNDPMGNATQPLPVEEPFPDLKKVYITGEEPKPVEAESSPLSNNVDKILNSLFRDDEKRLQLWPEKVVRQGSTAAGRLWQGEFPQWAIDKDTGEVHTSPQMIEAAQEMSALAGTGGLAGTGQGGVALGATPFLRPALKYKDKLYKGKEGQQHLDVIPADVYPEFQRQAMSGEDISHFNFGFVNDKGHFLDREKALQYGINNGLIDPQAGKFGALTSTLMADSSKPGMAIEAMKRYPLAKPNDRWSNTTGQNDHLMQTMTPDEFLNKGRPLKIDAESRESIDALKQHIKEGKPLDPLELHANGKEDGRHRAIAAKELGIKEVPVLNFRPPELKPAFYSAVEHNLAQIPQAKMTGEQWLGTLGNKPGVKPEEMQWTGLTDFLAENKGKPVTKAQIEEHLAANKVELKEVSKGGEQPTQYTVSSAGGPASAYLQPARFPTRELAQVEFDSRHATNPNGYHNIAELPGDGRNTKYHSYQLPGGENYREMLLTLPKEGQAAKRIKDIDGRLNEITELPSSKHTAETAKEFDALREERMNLQSKRNQETGQDYNSSHWDEPNILAHVRMNDRTIEGKKSLHLEEIQSDWHQQGREKGYKGQARQLTDAESKELLDLRKRAAATGLSDTEHARKFELGDIQDKAKNEVGVPDAPFKKSWHELALKRMLREASEKGYDRLSWTPGEAQATRYDLSKTLNKVSYNPQQKYLKAWDKNGNEVMAKEGVTPEQLPDFVGKEGAKSLLEQKPKDFNKIPNIERKDLKIEEGEHNYVVTTLNGRTVKPGKGTVSSKEEALEYAERYFNNSAKEINTRRELEYGRVGPTHVLEGQELKIGGEGMKGFYDQIIPKALEKLGKEHGVKVKKTNLPATMEEAKAQNKMRGVGQEVHYIDIPQSLKDTATQKGFPLFSKGGYMLMPVDHDPFEGKTELKT